MTLKRGDKVRLISRKEIQETYRKLNAMSATPVTVPDIPVGALGFIYKDEGSDGLAACSFELYPSMYVSAAMVEVLP